MKIKRKVQKNLPQLIEWAWDNGIDSRTFTSPKGGDITFDGYGDVVGVYSIKPNDTFTIEVEEEITEDTEFKSMVEVTIDDLFAVWENASISTWKSEHSKEFHAYIDGEFRCVWRNGKLVE